MKRGRAKRHKSPSQRPDKKPVRMPSPEAREFVPARQFAQEAWDACNRPHWLDP